MINRNAIPGFAERMEAAKARLPASGGKFYPRRHAPAGAGYDPASHEWFCAELRREWQRDVRRIANDFAVACLNPINDQPENWEF